ncbi:MAG: DNA translocase FtsK [Candidatus Pacebacteria bacterium]|nr:DNA translocase FtsK [Candidatus Paceibacterota bacterium]
MLWQVPKKDKERWDYFTQKVDAFFEAAFADEDIDELDFQKLRMEVDGWYPDDQDLRKNLIRSMDKRFDQFYDTIAIEKDRKMQIENSQIEMLRGEVPQPKDDEIVVEERTLPTTYVPPPLSLLSKSKGKALVGDTKANANLIKRTLQNFGIDVEMDEVSVGPTVTRYALKPAEGVKLSRIVGLQNDLALALAAHPLRIEAPIPGKALVGVEIPNRSKATVGLGSLIEEPEFAQSPKPLLVCLGKGVTGKSYYTDIAKMPHMLIAGTTGSGKSVTVHNLIISLLYRNGPQDLRFIMVDPKRVELTLYNKIPHLLTPVIKQPKKAILALKWAVKEMERRYDVLESEQVRDINSYHSTIVEPAYTKAKNGEMDENDLPERMPYIVIFIDELSDLMQAYPRELEAAIVRLAQMSRAVGIHLVLSTQRPSVNVITGLIKANVPARIALQVSSQIDSRTILDVGGAEKLLGAGDMLFSGGETNKPVRMQSAFITEDEVKKVVDHLIRYQSDDLVDEISLSENEGHADSNIFTMSMSDGDEGDDDDDLYEDAKKVVLEAGKASTSYLQRKLKVGYSRAARLIDLLEDRGVVGPANGSKPRDVIDGGADTSSSNDGGYLDDQEEPDTDETYDSDDYEDDDEEHEDA